MTDRDAYNKVIALYPGVVVDSCVQPFVYLECFEEGVESYKAISAPSPEDDRWVGVCYFQLHQDENALAALSRAVARGNKGAQVNLAHLLRFIDRQAEGAKLFAQVEPDELKPYDLVLFYRAKSLQEEMNGNIRSALKLAEEAWRKVQGVPEFNLLAPSILGQLGVLFGRIGHSQRALWYVDRGLAVTGGNEARKVRVRRALLLISLGRVIEAVHELDAIDASDNAALDSERLWLLGMAAWALNDLEQAISQFSRGIEVAVAAGSSYEEFLSQLPLATIYTFRREFSKAEHHLSRAQRLVADRSDRLSYRFREVQYRATAGTYTSEYALLELDALSDEFGNMGLLQEQGWVRLHMADILLRTGKPGLEQEIEALKTLAVSLQNPAFLTRELIFLPELREYLQRCAPTLVGASENALEVRTLGTEALVFRGAEVQIPLRKTVEVLAYVLEHKSVRLDSVVADVFPDSKPRAARSYFHQVRHHLAAEVPGLDIHYDRESKLYHLKSELDVLWDVAEVRAGRFDSPPGSFLPSSANRWTAAVDRELERYRTREA